MKPKYKLIGTGGSIFNLIGLARKAFLEKMTNRVYGAESYDQALQIIMEYVEVE